MVASISFRWLRDLGELTRSHIFLRELLRTLTAWAVLFVVGIWMVICQQWSDARWLRRLEQTTNKEMTPPWARSSMLQDIILEHLPRLDSVWVSDKLVGTSAVFCILGCSFLAHGWRERLVLLRRLAWVISVLYFLRSITISVTTVPPSAATCEISRPQSTWQVIRATPQILAGTIGQCTDKIFSGHTAILTVTFLFWRKYATHWGFVAYSAVHTGMGILSVLMARYHYTVDVVVGGLMTVFVHHLYYSMLDRAIRHTHASADMYKLGVLAQDIVDSPELRGDSAMGSGRNTPVSVTEAHGGNGLSINSNSAFAVRKRETSSATALSIVSEFDLSRPLADPPLLASVVCIEDETAVVGTRLLDQQDPRIFWRHVEEGYPNNGSPHNRDHYLGILGVNQVPSSLLPNIVAWMDGLDLRYKHY
ncbi:hypothetical protein GGI25_003278 [Coemansia spiralis]|uniref:Sphingomyelin synthase-like domain-containing protein n=2 Tax=Coemansia TaxID=4863 RepID=A0A9W8KYB5_9FUNG|nr:hypothetical protein EDC05_004342 [Coemansia umbellata]KAJ2621505.1 hypothetical protein GGI26_004085 [Coemansia sp. RSA 1358]KAJ2677181.1 hypothetical protein GGI25_003278 [Coemansia spiralis]